MGPGAAQEKFDELTSPIWTFTLHKVFSPVTRLAWVGGIMLVLRTFPKLVGRSKQNLVEIGTAVRA